MKVTRRGQKHQFFKPDMVVLYTQYVTLVFVNHGGPVVIILASGSEICRFDPGRGRWIFSKRKNPEDDFLRKGSKAVGPMS